jgi:hypothetical protein
MQPFEQQEVAPQLHTTSSKRMTAATTADYSDTGPENAKIPIFIKRINIITILYFKNVRICLFKQERLWKVLLC